ncbi:hypothetical protein BH09BAC5_BH09BAC5_28490 [soil metagenome]
MSPPIKINPKSIPGKVELWSDYQDISWMEFLPGSEIDMETMHEILRLIQTTRKPEEELLALIDLRNLDSISDEARTMAAGKDIQHIYKAMALVATSPAIKIVARFFIHFHKPPRPTKIFGTIDAAKKWLLTFKSE